MSESWSTSQVGLSRQLAKHGKTGAFVYAPLIGFILSHYGPAAGFLIFSGADPQIQHGIRDAQLEKLHGYAVRCSVFTNHDDRCSPVTNPVLVSISEVAWILTGKTHRSRSQVFGKRWKSEHHLVVGGWAADEG